MRCISVQKSNNVDNVILEFKLQITQLLLHNQLFVMFTARMVDHLLLIKEKTKDKEQSIPDEHIGKRT